MYGPETLPYSPFARMQIGTHMCAAAHMCASVRSKGCDGVPFGKYTAASACEMVNGVSCCGARVLFGAQRSAASAGTRDLSVGGWARVCGIGIRMQACVCLCELIVGVMRFE